MKEKDIVFVPFTTKMNSLEKLFHEELLNQINKLLLTTKKWLQTTEGLEYLYAPEKTYKIRPLIQELENKKLDTRTIFNLLEINYTLGSSYAHQSIGKIRKTLKGTHQKSFKLLKKGVQKILYNFKQTVIDDIKQLLSKTKEYKENIYELLQDLPNHHYSTPITPRTRSEMIARTEMVRSFNNGVFQTYSNYGIEIFEIVNNNDIGVCETCIGLIQNNPYTLEEITKLLPVHPNCRCFGVIYRLMNDIIEEVKNPIIVDMFQQ